VTIGLAIFHFLLVVIWTQVSISNGFRDIPPQTSCVRRHNDKSSLRMRDITRCVPLCKILAHISISHPHFAYSLCHFRWAPMKNKGCSLPWTSHAKGQIERKISKSRDLLNFGSAKEPRAGQLGITLLTTWSLAVSPQQAFPSLKSRWGYFVLTGKDQTASFWFLGRAASRYAGT